MSHCRDDKLKKVTNKNRSSNHFNYFPADNTFAGKIKKLALFSVLLELGYKILKKNRQK